MFTSVWFTELANNVFKASVTCIFLDIYDSCYQGLSTVYLLNFSFVCEAEFPIYYALNSIVKVTFTMV